MNSVGSDSSRTLPLGERSLRSGRRSGRAVPARAFSIRPARVDEARAVHRLISANLASGHLLPRTLDEIAARAHRFLVVVRNRQVVGCAELSPLSHVIAEIRSLVVDPRHRNRGLGSRLVRELERRARAGGYATLCAFTHQPQHFVHLGFSIVPHAWLPEKTSKDCHTCSGFRRCGQYAMVLALQSHA